MFDLIIRNGTVVDGSGAVSWLGDVAVRDGWIVATGDVEGGAAHEIDATGQLVTPGFVDLHTHYDGQAIWSERLSPSSDHGVTTVLIGNCGVGFAPCRPGEHDALISLLEGVEDIPEIVTSAGLTWDWESFPQYMDAVERRRHDIDIAVLMPHSPLRAYVMGARGIEREAATKADIVEMKVLVSEALDAGALGFGTSRAAIHRTAEGDYIPSYGAEEAELLGIAESLREAGHGLFQIIMNTLEEPFDTEFSVVERIAQVAGCPVTYTQGQPKDDIDFLGRLERANANPGIRIRAQMLPRPVGMIAGLTTSANPFCMLPSWAPLKSLSLAEKIKAMRDPGLRDRLMHERPHSNDILASLQRRFGHMFPIQPQNMSYEPDKRESIAARAEREGRSPEDVAYNALLEDDGRKTMLIALGNYHDFNLDYLETALANRNVLVGLGDGGAHYGFICDASYTTHALAYWTRDRPSGRFPIETMVNMLSRRNAEILGLHDRGLIAPGHRADINIIDYDHLRLHPPEVRFDLPAAGMRLHQRADGYTATIVAGVTIAQNGEPTGARPGKLIRGPQRSHHLH
jgi:N-acyl-D-aspartate/D-glutamate deacylase